jgi:hypothetical protein
VFPNLSGYAVVVVHHAGKNGQQRGASRREDLLDTSIKLEELSRDVRQGSFGAGFQLTFEKVRGKHPQPDRLTVELIPAERGGLSWTTEPTLSTEMRALVIIAETLPSSQRELANKLGITEGGVSQLVNKARDKGLLLKKGLALTKEGQHALNSSYQGASKVRYKT